MDQAKNKYKPTVVLQLCQTNHFAPLDIYFAGSNVIISPAIASLVSVVKWGLSGRLVGFMLNQAFVPAIPCQHYCSLKNLSLVICVSSLPVVTFFKHMHRPGGKFTSWICVVFILPSIFHDSGPENDLHVCAEKNKWKSQHFTIQRKCEKPTVQMFIQSRSPKRRRSWNTISSNFQPYLTCLLFSYSRSGRICLLCLESRRTKTR